MRSRLRLFEGKKMNKGDLVCPGHFAPLDEHVAQSIVALIGRLGDKEAEFHLQPHRKKPQPQEVRDEVHVFSEDTGKTMLIPLFSEVHMDACTFKS